MVTATGDYGLVANVACSYSYKVALLLGRTDLRNVII